MIEIHVAMIVSSFISFFSDDMFQFFQFVRIMSKSIDLMLIPTSIRIDGLDISLFLPVLGACLYKGILAGFWGQDNSQNPTLSNF
jgi:hypothetical protein